MIFIVLGGLVLKIWSLLGGLSFHDSLFALTPPIFQIAATRKRNGVEISNLQNFLVSMISTSILNKKKIHDIGCTPLFELGWNDPNAKKLHCKKNFRGFPFRPQKFQSHPPFGIMKISNLWVDPIENHTNLIFPEKNCHFFQDPP